MLGLFAWKRRAWDALRDWGNQTRSWRSAGVTAGSTGTRGTAVAGSSKPTSADRGGWRGTHLGRGRYRGPSAPALGRQLRQETRQVVQGLQQVVP